MLDLSAELPATRGDRPIFEAFTLPTAAETERGQAAAGKLATLTPGTPVEAALMAAAAVVVIGGPFFVIQSPFEVVGWPYFPLPILFAVKKIKAALAEVMLAASNCSRPRSDPLESPDL